MKSVTGSAPSASRWVVSGLLWCLAIAATIRYWYVTWTGRMREDAVMPYDPILLSDFRDAVWLPAGDFVRRLDPYDAQGFLERHPATQGYSPYTPHHLILTAPFAHMDWATATGVWTTLVVLSLAGLGAWTAVAIRRRLPFLHRFGTAGDFAALGVISVWVARSTTLALGLGQPTAIYGSAAAVGIGMAAAYAHDRDVGLGAPRLSHGQIAVLTGTAVVLGGTKAPLLWQVVLALGVLAMWRGLALGAVVSGVLSLAAVVWLTGGVGGVLRWITTVPERSVGEAPSRFDPQYVTENPWIDVGSTLHRAGTAEWLQTAAMAALAVLGVAVAVRLCRRGHPIWGALMATLTGTLSIPHARYDVMILIPVLGLCVASAITYAREHRALPLGQVLAIGFLGLAQVIPNHLPPWQGITTSNAIGITLLCGFAALLWVGLRCEDVRPLRDVSP